MEQYKGKYIFYSLGNFVFDQPQSQETKEGLTIKVYFAKDKIDKISILPIVMENFAQPKMAGEADAYKILQRLKFLFASKVAYIWNNSTNNFDKTSIATIYNGTWVNKGLASKTEQADLDGDSIKETYTLENGQLMIAENSKILWQSLSDWWIDDFVLADSNNDGIIDINLSVWKPGNFGPSKPFWIKENDMSIKNHFFVLDLVGDTIKPIWQSSNLGVPNCEFTFADIDGDRKNDLITFEGDYSQKPDCKGDYLAVWKWNGWGFSNEWRSEQGNFSNLEIERSDGKNYIIVDPR
jgi:poly-gamma-glutamate synthesis protein (capsule biosynthesis protein)